MDGKEVVQVYITDLVSSVVTPNQFLAGFQKVDIPCVFFIHFTSFNLPLFDLHSDPCLQSTRFKRSLDTDRSQAISRLDSRERVRR